MRMFDVSLWMVVLTAPLMAAGTAASKDTALKSKSGNTSVYTDLKLDECEVVDRSPEDEEGPGGAHLRCEGYRGIPVQVFTSDLRYSVTFGNEYKRTNTRSFIYFNELHTTLEWRLSPDENGKMKPIATILRYILETSGVSFKGGKKLLTGDYPILVVTQLKPGATCHIAYVDARANPKANEDARKAADRLAGSFDCSKPPERVGPQTPHLLD